MDIFSEAINFSCYVYDAYLLSLEELRKAGTGKELAAAADFLPCSSAYKVTRQIELKKRQWYARDE